MNNPVQGKKIVLGVTGSIAAYKAAEIASRLTQWGAQVDVVLTESAQKFVTPLTFSSVTGRPAYTEADLWGGQAHVTHIGIARGADLLVIVPASANTLAKLANGIGDNLLSVTHLAASCPLIIAPAMDAGMYSHPATQANVETLQQRGALFVGPAAGHLASGLVGVGRLADPQEILGLIRFTLSRGGPLQGKKVVITAGGTREPIDPVRVITNRSSGRQGYAVAQAALDAGAQVTLITTPTQLPLPYGAEVLSVETAAQMGDAVLSASAQADALIMSAAVADFQPVQAAPQKIKKSGAPPAIELRPTTDILSAVAAQRQTLQRPRVVIGFAAESQNLLENARAKLQAKRLEMIVANDISAADAGFEVNTNRVVFLTPTAEPESLPLLSKSEVAGRIVQRLVEWL
ncbi:phosphopantothenoylcysteine decarboxylase [Ornatilinea apprima]|uniref:Coenzyme A biosynthesis bifunctional protein CoaBC n=1 Tax=Ornatilinea apprima TaxID=1134406 RepID=A0A0N8GKL9_9CHLR|nr:bifunctional phosphopantothenoylcysteine decarboxylase/phosphopantothenate--cysteine ligase CoaBC [Ornatilinea apprima]KPL70066.1 phosphopantothenoylcysteine decarboxylase [Ornatilinea apprima]